MFRDLGLAFLGALIAIYVLLVVETHSFFMPLVIMASIPLGIIGIMPGFWLLNRFTAVEVGGHLSPVWFTATGMIGMIALAGIVIRNAIILIDFIRTRVAQGLSMRDAVLESGTERLRPIVLTAFTTMLGAWPITLDPIFSGLAWSLIFGILASTAFTLIVIPVVYYALYGPAQAEGGGGLTTRATPDTPYRFPPPAPAGARVHVIAPSGLVDAGAVRARRRWRSRSCGYEAVYEKAVIAASGRYTAGSDAARTAAVNAAVADPDASIVWAARGGYGATRVLPGLDLAPLEHAPQVARGLLRRDGAPRRVAPGRLGEPPRARRVEPPRLDRTPARTQLRAWLEGATTGRLEGRVLAGTAPAEGVLLGGNLSLLASLVGTPCLPPLDGAIVLLEDVDEAPYRLDRYLTQLRLSGALDGVRGFVLGQWTRCGASVDDALETLVERLGDLGRPDPRPRRRRSRAHVVAGAAGRAGRESKSTARAAACSWTGPRRPDRAHRPRLRATDRPAQRTAPKPPRSRD